MTGEVLDIRNEYGSYEEFKTSLDGNFREMEEQFVIIGYKLKVARDTDILRESGYANVNEFAVEEYRIDKSQVSRFIRINNEFSEGGYSMRLREDYRGFGYTKLALMLTLPPVVTGELSADYTKTEIGMIKDEIDEEKKRTDIEVLLEQKDGRQQAYGIFGRILYQIGRDCPELYLQMHAAVMEGQQGSAADRLADALAPAGENMISVRIPGERKMLLSIKGTGADPAVINAWTNERESCTWEAFTGHMRSLCKAADARESWEILYGEPFPMEEAPVAPVQPESGARQAPKKPQRVLVTSPQKPQMPEKTGDDKCITETMRKEGEGHHEDMEVAPVQPGNGMQEGVAGDAAGMGSAAGEADAGSRVPEETDVTDAAAPHGDGNGTEHADDAHGTGLGVPAAGVGSPAGTVDGAQAVMTQDAGGQMNIVMPDDTEAEERQSAAAGYLAALRDSLDRVYILTERGEYQSAEKWLDAVRGTIRKVREVSEAHDG
ncbi:MAG: hypothetical protein NC489_25505 [Ruminococcus flavefaciens]|nr:hypothetical protein [Ruminococcus flavefaciens]